MKNNYKKLCLMLLLATSFSYAQQEVWVDFGSSHVDWITGSNYNNYHYQNPVNYSAILINVSGANTPFTMEITDLFIDRNSNGTTAPTGDAAIFEVDATKDSLFGSSNHGGIDDQLGTYEITGLDNAKYYSFEIYACRDGVGGTRTAKYEFIGSTTKSGVLNASTNLSNTVVIVNVQPTGGKITFNTTPDSTNDHASKYFYLGSMKMEETVNALSVEDEILKNGGVNAYPNPVKDILTIDYILSDKSETTISIYDINGRLIYDDKNAVNQAGTYSYSWNRLNNEGARVTSGIYFLEFKSNIGKVTRKIILE